MSDEIQKVITDAVLDHIAEVIALLYQPKVTGKGLSTNDFTNGLKSKLEGIAAGAQVNVLEGVQVDGIDLTVNGKKVNIVLTDYAKKSDVTGAMKIQGSVASYSALPASPAKGDAYLVQAADAEHGVEAGEFVMWDGSAWQDMGGTVDLTAYLTKTGAAELYATKSHTHTASQITDFNTAFDTRLGQKMVPMTNEEVDAAFGVQQAN